MTFKEAEEKLESMCKDKGIYHALTFTKSFHPGGVCKTTCTIFTLGEKDVTASNWDDAFKIWELNRSQVAKMQEDTP